MGFWLTFALGCVQGQEAIRTSLAGEQAAEAQRQASAIPDDYNLKLGPTYWWFMAGLGIEYRDNVDYAASNRDEDFIFRPGLDTAMRWPVTEKNTLRLGLGMSYAAYVDRTDLNRLSIRPGSVLTYDMYAGDWRVTLYNRFAITQETFENPTVSGRGDYSRLENTTGAVALWDLHQLILSFGYHHTHFVRLSGGSQFPDGATDGVITRAGFLVSPTITAGIEGGGSSVRYRDDIYEDGYQYSGGLFAAGDVTQHVAVESRVGWVASSFTSDQDDLYGDLTIRHQVNERLRYSVSGGREVQAGLFYARAVETVDLYYARLHVAWALVRDLGVSTPFFYHRVQESGVSREEQSHQYGAGIQLTRPIAQKTVIRLQYQFIYRDSDLPNRDYTLNSVTLSAAHRF